MVRYFLVILAYGVLFSVWQVERVPWPVHLVAIVVAATSLVPLARWYASGSQGLPMFELICVSYGLQFSMPVYTQPNEVNILNQPVLIGWDTVLEVLLYVELGLLAMEVSYYLVRRSRATGWLPRLDLPLAGNRRSVYLWMALLGGGLISLLVALNWEPLRNPALGAIVRLVASQFNVALVLLAYIVYGERERRLSQVATLYAAAAFGFVVGLTTGMLETALMPPLLVLAVRWHATQRLPWLAIVAGMLLFLLLNPAKFQYREEVWYGGGEYGFDDRLRVWGDAVDVTLTDTLQYGLWQETARDTLARFDLVHKFAFVRAMTPAYIPYYKGDTYSYFLYSWIPRLLWPDKPLASNANLRIDVDYGFKYSWQGSTISIGQLPEAYANFGIVGIAVVMAIQGAIFSVLNSVLNGPQSEGGRAIYLAVMVSFLNGIGSTASMWFGALLQYVLASSILLRPFALGFGGKEKMPEGVGNVSRSAQVQAGSGRLSAIDAEPSLGLGEGSE
jgi:hypothetical protein